MVIIMSKHFKSKKKLRHDILIKYILILVLSYIILRLCLIFILFTPILDLTFQPNQIKKYKEYITNTTINKPNYLLRFNQNNDDSQSISANYVINTKPIIYVYNTHQQEKYQGGKGVWDAAYLFQQEMKKYNVEVLVEDRNITEFMQSNNIDYKYSYYASKFYVQDALEKNNLNLLIDLHRDAVSKKVSTVVINKKNYAKIMFVIGKEHQNYQANYQLANEINDLIKKQYPSLTRGVILKSGKNVNGIYNQNLSPKNILIELGGNYNTYDEVSNTISLLSKILGEYLHEQNKNR